MNKEGLVPNAAVSKAVVMEVVWMAGMLKGVRKRYQKVYAMLRVGIDRLGDAKLRVRPTPI